MTAMKERFSVTELTALRNDLLQSGMIDSREAAEVLQVFLMGRGYGVSPEAAMDAASRVEMAGCALPVLKDELENLALVMWEISALTRLSRTSVRDRNRLIRDFGNE
jgi:hypothetical protein